MDILRVFLFQVFWQKVSKPTKTSVKRPPILQYSFAQKSSLILRTSTHLTVKINAPETLPKTFHILQIFQQAYLSLVSEKTFALHHFLTPKKCILEALERECLYIFVYLPRKIFIPKTQKGLIWCGGGRLNNFLEAARCLNLAKCFTIFHFN